MPASVIAVAEADVEMVSLDTRAERQRQLIRHAQELHHLNLAAARQGLRERTAQADTAKVKHSLVIFIMLMKVQLLRFVIMLHPFLLSCRSDAKSLVLKQRLYA